MAVPLAARTRSMARRESLAAGTTPQPAPSQSRLVQPQSIRHRQPFRRAQDAPSAGKPQSRPLTPHNLAGPSTATTPAPSQPSSNPRLAGSIRKSRIPTRRIGTRRNPAPPTPTESAPSPPSPPPAVGSKRKFGEGEQGRKRARVEEVRPAARAGSGPERVNSSNTAVMEVTVECVDAQPLHALAEPPVPLALATIAESSEVATGQVAQPRQEIPDNFTGVEVDAPSTASEAPMEIDLALPKDTVIPTDTPFASTSASAQPMEVDSPAKTTTPKGPPPRDSLTSIASTTPTLTPPTARFTFIARPPSSISIMTEPPNVATEPSTAAPQSNEPATHSTPRVASRGTPGSLAEHGTPPTPAREILRLGAGASDTAAGAIIIRPPTPPRIAERTVEQGYPPLSTPPGYAPLIATPPEAAPAPQSRPKTFAHRINTLRAHHDTDSPATRPPLRIDTRLAGMGGPRRPAPGEDDPFYRPPRSKTPPRVAMPPPPAICVTDPDDVVIDQHMAGVAEASGQGDGAQGTEKEGAEEEEKVVVEEKVPVQEAEMKQDEQMPEPAAGDEQSGDVAKDVAPSLVKDAPIEVDSQPGVAESGEGVAGPSIPLAPASSPSTTAAPGPAPSGIPVATSRQSLSTLEQPPLPRLPSSGLPIRRPSSRPALGLTGPSIPSSSGDALRKTSYPSSLGSGPLRHQTARVVSNPVPPPSMADDKMDVDPPSPRSVSEPTRGASAIARTPSPPPARPPSRMSLSMSTRQEDTSRDLMRMSDLLTRLRKPSEPRKFTPAPRPMRISAPPVMQDDGSSVRKVRPPSRLTKSASTRPPLATVGEQTLNTGSHADVMGGAHGTYLKGVVAYVDVYTTEGDFGGNSYIEMLKRCGAKVLLKRPTESCTHIIWKEGRPSTANFVRRLEREQRPKVVGATWLTSCARAGARVPEDGFTVNLDNEAVFARKKSMQPKLLGKPGNENAVGPIGTGGASRPKLSVRPASAIRYAPKVGSPLRKSYVHRDE